MSTNTKIIYRGVLKPDWLKHNQSWMSEEKDYGIYAETQFQELKPVYDPSSNFKGLKRNRTIGGWGSYSLGVKSGADLGRYFTVPKYHNIDTAYEALKMYMSHPDFYITEPLAKDLKKQKIRLEVPVQVFRGLKIDGDEPIWDSLEVGQIVDLEDRYAASSWTTDVCIAAGFAYSGVVISYLAQPDEVVIDTRLLEPDILKDLYDEIQFEIMLDKRMRKVEIKLILQSDQPIPRQKYID